MGGGRKKLEGLFKYSEDERPVGFGKCYDCELSYEKFPCDIVLPHDLWEIINPSHRRGGGLLCPNCLLSRLRLVNTPGANEVFDRLTNYMPAPDTPAPNLFLQYRDGRVFVPDDFNESPNTTWGVVFDAPVGLVELAKAICDADLPLVQFRSVKESD